MHARRLGLGGLLLTTALVGALVIATSASAATSLGTSGEEAEQLLGPIGVAVDASGDLYVGDGAGNNRLDKFDASGDWLLAWGSGVLNGAFEMQTCTTSCRRGLQWGAKEAFELNSGVAVDNDPLSSSYGDVYVVDTGHKRIEKFDPSGKFILMFGGHLNETTGADICRAGEKCKVYATQGAENGEFEYWTSFSSFIAVGPGGAVYVGDKGRVEVFESSGAWKENISLAGLSSEARPNALAVDSNGDMFLTDPGIAGVREFAPNGSESSTRFDATSTSVTALATDSSGHLLVGDSNGGFHVLEYGPAGEELESFGRNTVSGENRGLAFSSTTGEVYAADWRSATVWEIPEPHTAVAVIDSESATAGLRGATTLEANVNPEGTATAVDFEYVDETRFKEGGYASATRTSPVSIGSGFADQAIAEHPTLAPGTAYHYRVVATNAKGTTTGEDQSFQETPPAEILGPWVSNVAGSSVTIGVRINPLGANTSFRLEYGTSTSYEHSLVGTVGEGMEYVALSRHVQELLPVTTYHYRVVTENEVGTWQSPDRTFTTQAAAGELQLPDGRAWELVSPANKHGAVIEPESGLVQAAGDGHGIAYVVREPITERATGSIFSDPIISLRGTAGWNSEEYALSERLSEKENEPHPPFIGVNETELFSTDLSQVAIQPGPHFSEPLKPENPASPQATEKTLYLYDIAAKTYLPLVTPANVPTGTKFAGAESEYIATEQEMKFVAATPDLSHVVFQSPLVLTKEAVEGPCDSLYLVCAQNLYEWSDGKLALVNIGPEGKPLQGETQFGGAFLGRKSTDIIHAVSRDGRRIVWAEGDLYRQKENTMYVRDMVEGVTKQFGGLGARFETAAGDGSRVFYWENSELYAFDFANSKTADVTATHGPGEHKAGVIDGFIMGTGEDGAYVYYAATGVLAPGAVKGEDNLYVSHYTASGWTTTFIATLSKADEFLYERDPFSVIVFWDHMDARVSPNGRYIAFMSSRPLTGYDNRDAISEQPDEEVYLYNAVSGHLVCASCNPSGARPMGLYVPYGGVGPLIDRGEFWREHWLAADVPLWATNQRPQPLPPAQYQPRYLSDSGRVFFNSPDALIPQDTNGLMDVYQYEPAGVGGCTRISGTFSEASGGCVDLISSGTSGGESAFMDASESGDDVFFVTAEKLVPEDYDTAPDVYDAHVCTTAAPCRPAPVSPPPCTSGDSCKGSPSPQPSLFGAPASATFSGNGNVATPLATRKPRPQHSQKKCTARARKRRGCASKKGHRRRAARRSTRATRRGR